MVSDIINEYIKDMEEITSWKMSHG
jgi:hypothetical protein